MSYYGNALGKDDAETLQYPTSSPGSCSSDTAPSLSRSLSSDCISLTCTETDVGDLTAEEDDAIPEMGLDLPGSCSDPEAPNAFPKSNSIPDDLHQAIRDDLHKQADLRHAKVAASSGAAGCVPASRLPAQHRSLLIGWMRQVTRALRLHISTLFDAVSILDRYVAAAEAPPPESLLQLLALACMSVAVKFNEVARFMPAIWLSMAVDPFGKRTFTAQDLQRYEWTVLQTIGWRLHEPNVYSFLEHFVLCLPRAPGPSSGAAAASYVGGPSVMGLTGSCALPGWAVAGQALALGELSLMYDTFLSYEPSTVAMACVAMAERMIRSAVGGTSIAGPQGPIGPVGASPVAIAVAAVAALRVEQLAPNVEPCTDCLAGCYALVLQGTA